MVLSSRARHHRTQFSVYQRAAQGNDATKQPQQHQRKEVRGAQQLKSQRGKYTGTNHIGNNKSRCRNQSELICAVFVLIHVLTLTRCKNTIK